MAQLLPRLALDDAERQVAVVILFGYLDDRSAIVRTFALDALARLAAGDAALQARVVPVLEAALQHGKPSEHSRASGASGTSPCKPVRCGSAACRYTGASLRCRT